jgi:hypothetical protein
MKLGNDSHGLSIPNKSTSMNAAAWNDIQQLQENGRMLFLQHGSNFSNSKIMEDDVKGKWRRLGLHHQHSM